MESKPAELIRELANIAHRGEGSEGPGSGQGAGGGGVLLLAIEKGWVAAREQASI